MIHRFNIPWEQIKLFCYDNFHKRRIEQVLTNNMAASKNLLTVFFYVFR